jgi:hypothetical protein
MNNLFTIKITRSFESGKTEEVVHGCTAFNFGRRRIDFFYDAEYPIFATHIDRDKNIVKIEITEEP